MDAWNATVQRQINNTTSVEVAYVGSKGTHGFAGNGPNYDVNPVGLANFKTINPATGVEFTQNERRPLDPPPEHPRPERPGTWRHFFIGSHWRVSLPQNSTQSS